MEVGHNFLFAILTVVITVLNVYICLCEVFHYLHSLWGMLHSSLRMHLLRAHLLAMRFNVVDSMPVSKQISQNQLKYY